MRRKAKCEAFLGMPSDEMPASESERAQPDRRKAKCEAFLGMPSDEMPASESERAQPDRRNQT